jgi:hypothetical protein
MRGGRQQPGSRGRARVKPALPAPVDPYRCENVQETADRFGLPMATVTRFRALASLDPETDPWIGTYTRPREFHIWLWNTRKELEKKYPNFETPKTAS